MAESFYGPSVMHNFCTSLPTLVIFHFFDDSHFSRCEVVSYCGFNSHFLMSSDVELCNSLSLLANCISSLENNVFVEGRGVVVAQFVTHDSISLMLISPFKF